MTIATHQISKKVCYTLITLMALSLVHCGKGTRSYKLSPNDTETSALKKCVTLSEKKRFEEAVECMQIFKSNFPNSSFSKEAELQIGDNYYRKKEYLLAAESYKAFAANNPHHEKLDYVYYRMGLSYEKELPKTIDRDFSALAEAKDNFEKVFKLYSGSDYASMAEARFRKMRKHEAEKHYYIGHFYFKTGEYRAAIPRLREITESYSDLSLAKTAYYELGIAYLKLGRKDTAREIANEFKEKFPRNDLARKLSKKLGA